jgi:hypothetical protein
MLTQESLSRTRRHHIGVTVLLIRTFGGAFRHHVKTQLLLQTNQPAVYRLISLVSAG